MPSGLSERFPILQQSPYDLQPPAPQAPPPNPTQHWVPSRYNVRATADDGRLVIWNTLSGSITVFKPEDRERVIDLLQKRGFEAPREKVVAYLADRGYLVKKGTNEFRVLQTLFGQQHYRTDALELILMSSEDCNFRCKYCYEDFARGTMTPEVRESIKNLVRKRIKKLNRFHVAWFGGEPLYGWAAIEELAPFFQEIAAEHGVPYGSNMTTNGYLLTPDVADKLFAWGCRRFQITLDGLPEHHDHSRVGRDGSPTFAQIFENLKSLARREEDFMVALRVNFDQANAGGLSKFIDMLAAEFSGDTRFNLNLHAVGKWGGPNDAALNVCGAEDAHSVEREIMAQARSQGLHFGSLRDAAPMGSQVCYAARPFNFLIGATGKVMKCTIVLDKDESNVVGSLTPEGDMLLDDDRMGLWTEPAFEQDGQCRRCVMAPNCQGIHCPLIRIQDDTQPCIAARKHPREELLGILDAPNVKERHVAAATSAPANGAATPA